MEALIRFEYELLAVETEHDVHVMVELVLPPAPEDAERTPLRLALALDRSGSMQGEKLDTVKRCARFLVDRLDARDRVALITYDSHVDLLSSLSAPDPDRLAGLIDDITPGGMTNLSGGWLKALEELDRADDGIRRALLLTDGLANQGVVDPGQLTAIARSSGERGVSTTTVGVGDSFAEELLTDLSDAAGGRAWYAESVEDIPGIFAEEFDDLVAIAAQNVSIELRPGPEVQLLAVLNDYPSVAVDGGVQVMIGDAFADQRLRVVLRLHVPNLAALGLQQIAEVVLRYVTVGEEVVSHQQTLPVTVNAVSAEDAASASGDPDVSNEIVVLLAARATDEARRLADRGEHARAGQVLSEAAGQLRAAAPRSEKSEQLLEQARDLQRTEAELHAHAYDAAASKRLHYRANEMKRNRRRRNE